MIRPGREPILMGVKHLLINTDIYPGETLLAIAGVKQVRILVR
jgi:hypothetical protein